MTLGWTYGSIEFEMLRIGVSQEQLRIVEEGGEVLMITGLPAPEAAAWIDGFEGETATDATGETVMVAGIFEAKALSTVYAGDWATSTVISLAEHFEDSAGPDWRRWPTYLGLWTNLSYDETYYAEEEPQAFRVWSGIPIDESNRLLAYELVDAQTRMLNASEYYDLVALLQMDTRLNEGDWFDVDDENDEDGAAYTQVVTHLVQVGILAMNPPAPAEEIAKYEQRFLMPFPRQITNWSSGPNGLTFDPISEHSTNPAVHQLWADLRRSSRINALRASRVVLPQHRSVYVYSERDYEPWF